MTNFAQGARFAIVALVVVLYIAAGVLFAWSPTVYVLLGLPATAAFQLVVARRPLRAVWLREAPPLRVDLRLIGLSAVFAAVPAALTVTGVARGNVWTVLAALAIAFGAIPTAYALRALTRESARTLAWTCWVAGAVGTPLFLGLAVATIGAELLADVGGRMAVFGLSLLQYLPSMFVVEEVFFRGALDAYLHRAGDARGGLSAVFQSALWGIWHIPLIAVTPGLASLPTTWAVVILIAFHVGVGVPMTLGWRRSGNLAVPGVAHTLGDSVRNALLAR